MTARLDHDDPPEGGRSPILEVLALPSFRRYWCSQLGIGLVNGTVRFALVWLVLELTDWSPAVGLVGLALGIPAMLVTLPAGAVLGGAAIALAGTGGAMALLGAIALLSALGMAGVSLPQRPAPGAAAAPRMVADTVAGLRFALGREPLRSMLAIGFVASSSWGVVQLVLPDVMRSTLGQEAFAASMVFGALAVGMFFTTLYLSNRQSIRRRGLLLAIPFSGYIGTGMVIMGLSRSYALTFAAMAAWGVSGGIVITLQRTLLQEATPDEYMGRVMGCNAFAMTGSYPLAAALVAGSTAVVDGPGTLVLLGATIGLAASLVVWRPAVRRI